MAKKAVWTVPQVIGELVEKFAEHRETYHRAGYNETQLRQDFLDPLFEALGWDVNNRQGFAEAYRDVILEQSLRVEKSVRAPDYCFRIGGTAKFFVEAKKPAIDVKSDVSPAFQLRRYAWTAKLPLSILTDFEELAVYDCRVKPDKDDKASTARVLFLQYTEYVDRWEEIAGIFSRDAILRGSFDKYAESTKKKRGTAEVDEAFLAEIESWRELLAKNLSARNDALSDRELNSAVQLIIDRIIFLRMCEGRAIEDYGRLQALLNGPQVYPRLVEMFHRADEKYNSGLFHFQAEKGRENPDTLTTSLAVDDKVLKDIVRRLYYPESPYEFAAMPAEILGQVYEQFLGKVIRLTAGHRAKIEEKPEVRKAGGVYYTPTYIVDYIVQNTVGKLVEGKSVQEVSGLTATFKPSKTARPLTVLDPACGSGSFLIVAYQYLLDWYLKQYTEVDDPQKHARGANPRIYQAGVMARSPDRAIAATEGLTNDEQETSGRVRVRGRETRAQQGETRAQQGDWRLTIAERKRILLAHIYGVDIDYQACEVTKLSLLLKALEGATRESVERMLFHKERALPDLAGNIKCGNSLIGPDFYAGRQRDLFDEDEVLRINAFDWQGKDGFPQVFPSPSGRGQGEGRGGFDVVIGNPPYIRMEAFKELKQYLRLQYAVHEERADLYSYFIEKGHQLLSPSGRFGMIVSNKFIRANYGKPLREFLDSHAHLCELSDFAGLRVFKGATVRPVVLISNRDERGHKVKTRYLAPISADEFAGVETGRLNVSDLVRKSAVSLAPDSLTGARWLLMPAPAQRLLAHLGSQQHTLSDFVDGRILWGIKTGLNEAFVIDADTRDALIDRDSASNEIIKPFLAGEDINRYAYSFKNRYLIYAYHGVNMPKYPAVEEYLAPYKDRLRKRATKQKWFELQQPSYALVPILEAPKIVYPEIADTCRFCLDANGHYCNNKTFVLPTQRLDILGVLNSRVAFFYFSAVCAALESGAGKYLEFRAQYLSEFPVPLPIGVERRDKSLQRLETLVQRMLDLNKRVREVKTAHERSVIERRIEATDREIDQLVYDLYGLSDKEIALVEEATGR